MNIAKRLLVFVLAMILTIPVTALAEDASGSAQAPAAPVAAAEEGVKTFETSDGVLSMKAPADNDKWAVIQDDQRWFTMSDGTDTITVDHYFNGDLLPAATVAKAPIVQVYQVHFSTENEVFVVTGEVTAAEDMPYVREAVNSFQVLRYAAKKPAESQPEASYGIRDIQSDMYCITTDGVNVRASYSTSSDIIGGISYREKVFVIGEVTKDGADTGWLKIQYGNGEGYVYDEWFDVNEPSTPERSGESMTVYSYDGSRTRTIYFYTDGIWRDDDGNTYQGGMSAEVNCSDGTVWYESPVGPTRTGDELTLYRDDGEKTMQIYYYSDNQWRDDNGHVYYCFAEHEWTMEGIGQHSWFDDPSYIDPTDPYPTGDELTLYRDDGEETMQIYYYSDNQWRDDNGHVYYCFAEHEWTMEGIGQHSWFDDPSYIDQPTDPYPTGDELTLYREDGGSTKEIYYYSDNQWRDDNGQIYYSFAEHMWQCEGIGQYNWYDDPSYIDQPDTEETEPYPTGDEITLYRADGGNTIEIYYYSDDQWRDDGWRIWYPVAEHEWDMEGTSQYVWYDDPGYINY